MKKSSMMRLAMLFAAVIAGCAPTRTWTSSPPSAATQNNHFSVRFTPARTGFNFISQFELEITNHGPQALEIDWVNTRYLHQDRPAGGFIFAGLDESNVNNPPPDVVPPGAELRKLIAPLKFIAWRSYKPGFRDLPAFKAGPLPAGKNGILLRVRQAGQVFAETLTVTIKIEKQ